MRPSAFKHTRITYEVIPHVRPTVPLWPCNKNSKLDNVTRTEMRIKERKERNKRSRSGRRILVAKLDVGIII